MKKEEAIEKIGELKKEISLLEDKDQNTRKEFAKAFSWYKRSGMYGSSSNELRTPSWAEVFVELGKYLDHKENTDALSVARDAHRRIDEINNRELQGNE